MSIPQYIKTHFVAKTFRIELDDEFCYPSENNPVVFMIDGKEKYRADLGLGRQRFNQGYYIKCRQILS